MITIIWKCKKCSKSGLIECDETNYKKDDLPIVLLDRMIKDHISISSSCDESKLGYSTT